MDETFLAQVREKGRYLMDTIHRWNAPCVDTVRGLGLMVGIVLKEGVDRSELVNACYDRHLLVLTAGPKTIRLLPPLVISQEEMDKGLAVLKTVLCG
jgi:acetylornithine/N-succinyldiaminopimelate aminotransferase